MALRCGIIGLPNVGKSTIFNALTQSSVPAENYPFCTIDAHIGVVPVPDSRLNRMAEIYRPEKVTSATVEFTDIAGLVRGASKGEGLGNQFLGQIRQVAAIIHVVRCFEDDNTVHVEGSLDPVRDAELIETELLLADLESLEKRIRITEKVAKKEKAAGKELIVLEHLLSHCSNGHRARTFPSDNENISLIQSLHLLTSKPILYVANVDEKEIIHNTRGKLCQTLFDFAENGGNLAIRLCGSLEQEISSLPEEEKPLFLSEYNISEQGLHKLIHAGFRLLELETFFTGGPKEVRSWTIKVNTTAPKAAAEIHTDFERGFIKAEVFSFLKLDQLGSEKAVKEAGHIQLQGKDYVVRDGDCIYFHFNV